MALTAQPAVHHAITCSDPPETRAPNPLAEELALLQEWADQDAIGLGDFTPGAALMREWRAWIEMRRAGSE
jgi:hypothetical protein